MSLIMRESLTYDDVLLVPQYSALDSRSKVDLSVNVSGLNFDHPIIPANMKTVAGIDMLRFTIESGGLAILHRFMEAWEQLDIAQEIKDIGGIDRFAVSVGIKNTDRELVSSFIDIGVHIICIDVAHGDSKQCVDMVTWIKSNYPNVTIIAGNVATGSGARRLWLAGADIVKVGVGPGSLCTTRIETGNGVAQLTAIMDVAKEQASLIALERTRPRDPDTTPKFRDFPFIADGGIKNAGDIVKALCFADMIMAGNLFAGTDESPGELLSMGGHSYKRYAGSSTHKVNHIEGVVAMVPCKGPTEHVLTKLLEGLRSGCSYQGVDNLKDLKESPVFMKISNAGLQESHPHDVILK
jgi:IMP dehydrogenase